MSQQRSETTTSRTRRLDSELKSEETPASVHEVHQLEHSLRKLEKQVQSYDRKVVFCNPDAFQSLSDRMVRAEETIADLKLTIAALSAQVAGPGGGDTSGIGLQLIQRRQKEFEDDELYTAPPTKPTCAVGGGGKDIFDIFFEELQETLTEEWSDRIEITVDQMSNWGAICGAAASNLMVQFHKDKQRVREEHAKEVEQQEGKEARIAGSTLGKLECAGAEFLNKLGSESQRWLVLIKQTSANAHEQIAQETEKRLQELKQHQKEAKKVEEASQSSSKMSWEAWAALQQLAIRSPPLLSNSEPEASNWLSLAAQCAEVGRVLLSAVTTSGNARHKNKNDDVLSLLALAHPQQLEDSTLELILEVLLQSTSLPRQQQEEEKNANNVVAIIQNFTCWLRDTFLLPVLMRIVIGRDVQRRIDSAIGRHVEIYHKERSSSPPAHATSTNEQTAATSRSPSPMIDANELEAIVRKVFKEIDPATLRAQSSRSPTPSPSPPPPQQTSLLASQEPQISTLLFPATATARSQNALAGSQQKEQLSCQASSSCQPRQHRQRTPTPDRESTVSNSGVSRVAGGPGGPKTLPSGVSPKMSSSVCVPAASHQVELEPNHHEGRDLELTREMRVEGQPPIASRAANNEHRTRQQQQQRPQKREARAFYPLL